MSNNFPDIESYNLDDEEKEPNPFYRSAGESGNPDFSDYPDDPSYSGDSPDSDDSSDSGRGGENQSESPRNGSGRGKPMRPIVALLYAFIAPVKAWKELHRIKSPEEFASGCFYPLIALATASSFMSLAYDPELKLADGIIRAVVVFIAFFLGYFCVLFICRLILPEDGKKKIDTPFGRIYLMTGMSTLALFFTLGQLLPDLDALLVFLPLFTVYLSARGAKYLRIKEAGENITGWIAALLEIFVPYAIYELFPLILPNG